MIDTHTHLAFREFGDDLPAVLARAREGGITHMIVPGTDLRQSREALALAEREPDVSAAIGAHPHDVASVTEHSFLHYCGLVTHPKVVAVGEVGLEKSDRAPDLELQKSVLRWFVSCAKEHHKPMIFHVRDAHAEFREFLDNCADITRGVVHCFSGTPEDAQFYLERGLYISVTGIVTFPNAQPLRDIMKDVPLTRLLLETDSPFLAPQSRRGERNEPSFIREVSEAMARIKNVAAEEVERVTDENARALFGVTAA